MSSRKEATEKFFVKEAKAGKFTAITSFKIYKSEIKNLIKEGLSVKPQRDSMSAVYCDTSWKEPVWESKDGPPLEVLDYIEGISNSFPHTENLAQKLYTIAARANHIKKAQTINE